jgi:predicted transposase YbfD/YdcC
MAGSGGNRKVIRTRDAASTATTETTYYLLSAALSLERLGQVARSHWGVENRLHWILNAVMHEDKTRNRNDNSAYNLAILRHMAFKLMQRDRSRVSLRSKFDLAAWKDEFLAELLSPI